jgi:sugar-specific transcriptional regulator TrmB
MKLLKLGSSSTGPIIKATRLANSRVYYSLDSLVNKGLVTYYVKNNVKYFKSEDPDLLIKELEEKKKKVQEILPQLKALKIAEEKEQYTAVYEGFNGFRNAFEKLIEACKINDEVYAIGFSPQIYALKSLRIFLKNIDLKRYKKKVKLKIILDKKLKNTIGKDREKEPFTEVKYMPEGYFSPAGMNIFKDYVLILLWEEKPFGFMIKNQKIADSFKQYFRFLWEITK